MKTTNRKKAIVAVCITIPAIAAAILIPKAVKTAKRKKYATH